MVASFDMDNFSRKNMQSEIQFRIQSDSIDEIDENFNVIQDNCIEYSRIPTQNVDDRENLSSSISGQWVPSGWLEV